MDDEQQLRALLTRAADAIGEVTSPPADTFTRVRRRRGTSVAVLAPVCVVLAVVALAVALHIRGSSHSPAAHPTPAPTVGVGVSALSTYRWSTLPAAPIAARYDAAAVWTGSELLVWGGTTGNDALADGATYNPKTRLWDRLPTSPLTGRVGPAYVWTGSRLFIWGDTDDRTTVTDGATYDPTTRRWTTVPPAPVGSYRYAYAYAVGSTVVLLTTEPDRPDTVDAAAYHQSSSSWTKLPSLHVPRHHDIQQLVGLVAGDRLFVWSEWAHVVAVHLGSDTTPGVDSYTFDPKAEHWSSNRLSPGYGKAADQPLWTGSRVILPAQSRWCGYCAGPPEFGRTGVELDPADGHRSVVPHGPVDDMNATFVWTGAALLGVAAATGSSGQHPGEVAAWNPTTGAWTRLRSAPGSNPEDVVVWTGSSVLVWGQDISGSKREVGLEFRAPTAR